MLYEEWYFQQQDTIPKKIHRKKNEKWIYLVYSKLSDLKIYLKQLY